MTDQPKEEKNTMKEQRDRFLAFAFSSADLFMEISGEGRITHALGAAKGVTGIDEKSLVGRKWLEIFSVYEQATLISTYERAKTGMRVGPVLVSLSDALGARKAIMTAIKMPGNDKFYITLGLSSAIMARIAHAVSQSQGFEILTHETFTESAQNAVKRTRISGQEINLTFFDFAPTRLERTRMGEGPWLKLREALAEFLIAEAFDGYTAGEINDGRFSLIHDRRIAPQSLQEKMTNLTKQNDPSGEGLAIKVKSIMLDGKALNEHEIQPALIYTLKEFGQKGTGEINFTSLSAALKSYIASSAPKIKEFQAILERSGFSLNFQPIVNLKTGEAALFEMFCQFEEGNTREWMKFAENANLTIDLDKAMYERAISHAKFKAGNTRTKFAVNLSIRSVENDKFAQEFLERMETHKTLADRLQFEIADSFTFRDISKFSKFVSSLKKLGFKVALDHFKLDPTAAEVLAKILPDAIKLDRYYTPRLLTSQRDVSVARTLVEACEIQKVDLIGKWVEDKTQLDAMIDLGFGFAQGHYFGRPGPKPDYFPPSG